MKRTLTGSALSYKEGVTSSVATRNCAFYHYCFDTEFSIKIYTRWGKKVFEDDKIDFRWDGKMKNGTLCKDGVYFYNIDCPIPVAPKRGAISIIR